MAGAHDFLIPHYVEYVRQRRHLAAETDREALELAAHLFVVAQQLVDDGHDLRAIPACKHNLSTFEELLEVLANLPADISAIDLYGLLLKSLSLLERGVGLGPGYQVSIPIEPLDVGGEALFGGIAMCWLRTKRAFFELREHRYTAARAKGTVLPADWQEQPGRHLDRLFCFWQRGRERPKVSLALPEDPWTPLLRESGLWLTDSGGSFRIALCPLTDASRPCFELVNASKTHRSFRAGVPLIEGNALREQLELIFALAAQNEIHLVVFPELSIDGETRAWVSQRLLESRSHLPFGVIAGSFHIDREGLSRPYNESLFVDVRGRKLLEHWKRGRYEINRRGVEVGLKRGIFKEPERWQAELSQSRVEVEEHIEPGHKIELLETALGQMAVLICADAIDDKNRHEMRNAIRQLRPDFVFIPSMSPETDLFEEFAADMERLGVATFFVNAHSFCPEAQTLAAVCLDLYRGEKDHPTRVRWRQGRGIEQWLRKTHSGDEGHWVSFDLLETPFDWLSSPEGERLGLVVDLGAYGRPEEQTSASKP